MLNLEIFQTLDYIEALRVSNLNAAPKVHEKGVDYRFRDGSILRFEKTVYYPIRLASEQPNHGAEKCEERTEKAYTEATGVEYPGKPGKVEDCNRCRGLDLQQKDTRLRVHALYTELCKRQLRDKTR